MDASVEARLPPRLAAATAAVAARLAPTGADWWIASGCALRLQGGSNRPSDLDLECPEPHMDTVCAALGLTARRERGERIRSRHALGVLAGAELDVSAGLTVHGPGGVLPADDALVREWCAPRTVGGHEVLCAPPEEALVRWLAAGYWHRIAALAAAAPAPPRLDYVVRRLASSKAVA